MDLEFNRADGELDVSVLRFAGERCNHIGGIDVYDDEVYLALEKCSDEKLRVVVTDAALAVRRSATVTSLGRSIPWVAINPIDDRHLYTVRPARDGERGSVLALFDRQFVDGAQLDERGKVDFEDRPEDVPGVHFVRQGGAFSANGLFFRVVDDSKDEDAAHTGVWVYELDPPGPAIRAARRVGFMNIRYDPDAWFLHCGFNGQCMRSDELEDIDARSIDTLRTLGDVHVVMLHNRLIKDRISVYHYRAGDLDRDGIRDTVDNCLRRRNPGQTDLDRNGVGLVCDRHEIRGVLVPALVVILL